MFTYICCVQPGVLHSWKMSTAPQMLVLHLKRYSNNRKKNLDPIEFPVLLDMSEFAYSPHAPPLPLQSRPEFQYTLFAVTLHYGLSIQCGIFCLLVDVDPYIAFI